MKKKNGYTVVDLLIVIVVFGAITLFTISKVSYALSDDSKQLYDLQVKLIETQAEAYGQTKIEEIKTENMTITVNQLINDNYLQADDEKGNVFDPRNKSKTLNDKKIILSYDEENNKIKAEYKDK